MTAKSIKRALFAILVTTMAFPAMHMANATDIADRDNENREELESKIQALKGSTDPEKLAERDYYQSALNIIDKMELKSQATGKEEIGEIDREIGRNYNVLVEYIKENGSHITATASSPNTLASNGNLDTQSITENTDMPAITKTTSGKHVFSTAHSRNNCYATSHGTMSGSLTDMGNSQQLTVFVAYPSSIKSGGFPNCNIHNWSYGQIGFVDVFGLILCTSTASNNSGLHTGTCHGWPSVGPLTIAAANGYYSGNTWYAGVPAIGLVL